MHYLDDDEVQLLSTSILEFAAKAGGGESCC
jgi:hypothetical protein